jgi:hypothetical protein
MPLDPSEYLRLTRLSDDCAAFIVGANEAHVTVLSQQQRALNLAFALDSVFLDGLPGSVGIVGAGFAGITAATALALRGHNVTIYEQAPNLIPVQLGCEKRHIDPHIYDWPAESWKETDAGLPTLNWQAGPAAKVRESVVEEFEEIRKGESSGEIDVRFRTVVTGINGNIVSAHDLHSRSFDRAQHAAIVLAAGFGQERTFPGLVPYWHDDDLDQTFASELKVHISGTGDGALMDALRASTANFSLSALRQALGTDEMQALRRNIISRNSASPAWSCPCQTGHGFRVIGRGGIAVERAS